MVLQSLKNLINNIRTRFRKYIDCILENSNDWFLCFYPGNSGLFIKILIRRLVSKLNFDDHNIEKIKQIDKDAIVVYASKNKRMLDFLYYHTKLKSLDLPYPQIAFDFKFFFLLPVKRLLQIFICHLNHFLHHFELKDPYTSGYAVTELTNGKAGFISLIEADDFHKRFIQSRPDPLSLLIELQKDSDNSVIIIPENIIYVIKPTYKNENAIDMLFGTHEKPGRIKRYLTILRHPQKIRVEFANPVNLKEFINRPEIQELDAEFQTHHLRRLLIDILNRQLKSITGPVLKSRQEMTEDILTRKALREYLAEYASEHNITLSKTHKKAAGYIKEIAANYNLKVINFGAWLLTWIFKNIFEDIVLNQDEINRMREKSTKAPLILVPCHKSHLDYLLLPYVMYKNNMPCPHIAAGKNLSFWPLGPIFRRGGAFFLRRTFQGAPLYAKIFAAYLQKLLYEGFNIKIFVEGGRSRTGKLLPPKPGGLAMLINAYLEGACKNLYFVPIFIGYDQVLEEDAYLNEMVGGKKKPENIKGLLNARKFLKKKYGKVYIRFDEPISIKTYITKRGVDLSKASPEEYFKFVKGFGYKLINAINDSAVATPHGIVASGILNCPKNSFSKKQLFSRVRLYMNILIYMSTEMSDILMVDPDNALKSVTTDFISRNIVEFADEDDKEISENTVFIVKDNKRAVLDYYKNSVISFFTHYAYTAVAILEIDRFHFSSLDLIHRFKFLEKMFKDEFFYNEDISIEENIDKCLRGYVYEGILVPDNTVSEMYRITSKGLRKLKWFAAFLLPFLESYKTTLLYFEKYKADQHKGKERVKKISSLGSKLYKGNLITLKESLSSLNYQNSANYFLKNKINGSEDHIQIKYYKEIIDRLIILITT
ncbi:MAG: 1-acyl-sn-glycerol-3-phosphate acyltransferase [Pseudomonadota bacterium]